MDNEAIVRAFYQEIWEHRDLSRVSALISEDFVFRGSLGPESRGHAKFAAYVYFVHAALGEYLCRIEDLVSDDERVFARMTFSGVHRGQFLGFPPTGKLLSWSGAALFTIRCGRIASLWVLGDLHGLQQQLAANAAIDRR
jgi:steroid delta-isomerase-like uncharacterized protein